MYCVTERLSSNQQQGMENGVLLPFILKSAGSTNYRTEGKKDRIPVDLSSHIMVC